MWSRALRWVLAGLAVLIPSVVWGVATASADASLGPHLAHYEVTLDQEITIDLGPLGTLVIDSPVWVLGARVVVQEIPREVTSLDAAATLDALGQDLESYVQFFTGPQESLEVAVRALLIDALRRSVIAVVVVIAGIWAVRLVLGRQRRAELGGLLHEHRGIVAGTTVALVLVTGTLTASSPRSQVADVSRQASAVFDGTPLEGARITGRLAGVIDTYGGQVVAAYRDNEEFYDAATANLRTAWDERARRDAALSEGSPGAGSPRPENGSAGSEGGAGGPDASGGDGAGQGGDGAEPGGDGAEGDDGAGAGSGDGAEGPVGRGETGDEPDEPDEPDEEGPDPVVMLVVSDLHCNVGMARVIREAAELSGAQIVLNAGDTTVNGTAVESYCVKAVADAVPPGGALVVADGNHDSEETSAQERASGAVVLDGAVVEVHGVRILGDSDPNATRIGSGTRLAGEETAAEVAERLAEVACADRPDILLVHNPRVGDDALARRCVPAQISGHWHRRVGPVLEGDGVRYVSSSTAGATLGEPTIGPLNGVAEMTVLRFDPETRRIIDYRLIQVHPDADVNVAFALDWPVRRPPPPPPWAPV